MHILLTGGSGDLGHILSRQLDQRGDIPVRLDVRPPLVPRGIQITGSILDRHVLQDSMQAVDTVVHIAAWHGIHWVTKQKDAYDFWDLNVTGTFNVFEAAVRAGIRRVIYISSSSVDEWPDVYGATKVLGEEIARTYAARHRMNVIVLRPRAFIPHWNRATYTSFVEFARWFWGGAVHIDDVCQAVMQSIDLVQHSDLPEPPVLAIDGAYDYTDADMATWDNAGPGSTFRRYYAQYEDMVLRYGLDPAARPTKLDLTETRRLLGYLPHYSLRNLLADLAQYGTDGPPAPE